MQAKCPDWYKHGWSLDVKNQSWVEDTENQVAFIIKTLVCNAEHAEHYFPKTSWEIGEKALALAQFDWNKETRRMLFGGFDIPYGIPAQKPQISAGDPTRLYSADELSAIFEQRKMKIVHTFSDYNGSEASYRKLQLLVYSIKL